MNAEFSRTSQSKFSRCIKEWNREVMHQYGLEQWAASQQQCNCFKLAIETAEQDKKSV